MAWTTPAEVTAAWIGGDAPTDTALVAVWVDKAERLLRAKVPTLASRVAADPVVEPDLLGNVKDVVTEMVQEVFRNPERIRTRQESAGPYGGSLTYGGEQPGALRVTAEQIETLSPVGTNRGAFSIDTVPVTSPFSPHYVPPIGGW